MFLIFDTETTGLPKQWNAPITNTENWPRCVQIAWQLHDDFGNCTEHKDYIVYPKHGVGQISEPIKRTLIY